MYKILIIEDDQAILKALESNLKSEGYEIERDGGSHRPGPCTGSFPGSHPTGPHAAPTIGEEESARHSGEKASRPQFFF
jgi:hypothetical protein